MSPPRLPARLIVCSDDFGLDSAVNEAVEIANRDGILTCASLMVAAPAAADAIARAGRLPNLHVGLHLVVASGRAMLPAGDVPALVDADGEFGDALVAKGFRYAFDGAARRQLERELRAQFEAFRATGLTLDHVNVHRHLHLHPFVGRLMLALGRHYGAKAVRVPREPLSVLRAAGASAGEQAVAALHAPLAALFGARAKAAGFAANDNLLGLAWTGGMTEERLLRLVAAAPAGVSELYLHPAASRSDALVKAMPDYRQVEELAALTSPAVRRAIEARGVPLIAYGDLG